MHPTGMLTDLWVTTVRTVLPQRGAVANARDALLRDRWSAAQRREAAMAAAWAAGHPSVPGRSPVRLVPRPVPAGERLGLPLTPHEQDRVADVAPGSGFAAAAEDALGLLHEVLRMDVWMVTRVDEGLEKVVVARSASGAPLPPGAAQPWADSYCRLMVKGEGPRAAPRVRDVPAYAASPATARWGIAAYVGVPLLTAEGDLFGVLCGLSARELGEEMATALPEVERVARLLSTVLAKEHAALERSQAAAQAYALADRDAVTGVLNRRGWHARLTVEDERRRRHGHLATVLLVRIDDPPTALDGAALGGTALDGAALDGTALDGRCPHDRVLGEPVAALCRVAEVLTGFCRSTDAVARVGAVEFGVLAVECDADQAAALCRRIGDVLRHEGIGCTVTFANGDRRRDLLEAWRQADSQREERGEPVSR